MLGNDYYALSSVASANFDITIIMNMIMREIGFKQANSVLKYVKIVQGHLSDTV